jgi:hypothetical protein
MQQKYWSKEMFHTVFCKTLRPGRSTARKIQWTAGRWCCKRQNPKAMGYNNKSWTRKQEADANAANHITVAWRRGWSNSKTTKWEQLERVVPICVLLLTINSRWLFSPIPACHHCIIHTPEKWIALAKEQRCNPLWAAKPPKKALLQIQNKMNENSTIQIRTNTRVHLPFF